jgi:N-acetylmuramoyl-L-alanine amidase
VPGTDASRAEVADFVQIAAAESRSACITGAALVDGKVHCEGRPIFVPGAPRGRLIEPTLLVLHDSAGPTLEGVLEWLTRPASKASVHFLIDRDGTIVQLVSTNRLASHAGPGKWRGKVNVNRRSIAILFINEGRLSGTAEEGFYGPSKSKRVPENEVLTVSEGGETSYWHRYTGAQIESGEALAKLLAANYPISEIIGHCNISASKLDPGPAFPQKAFGEAVIGRGVEGCVKE